MDQIFRISEFHFRRRELTNSSQLCNVTTTLSAVGSPPCSPSCQSTACRKTSRPTVPHFSSTKLLQHVESVLRRLLKTTWWSQLRTGKLEYFRSAILNRRDLETFLPGPEIFYIFLNEQISPWISFLLLILVIKTTFWTEI